ncbi:MAG: hypothetical protein Q9201_004757 [Fulgogasparrea decipioides]
MAAADSILLSSPPLYSTMLASPPPTSKHLSSSSPGLPPLSEILESRIIHPASHNRAADDGFVSANTLLRAFTLMGSPVPPPSVQLYEQQAKFDIRGPDEQQPVPSMRKRKCPKSEDKSERPRRTRKSLQSCILKVSPHFHDAGEGSKVEHSNDSGATRQLKQPKETSQTRIERTKVTKLGACANAAKRSKDTPAEKDLSTTGPNCRQEKKLKDVKNSATALNDDDLGLIEAIKRRREWTPVKDRKSCTNPTKEDEAVWDKLVPSESPYLSKSKDARLVNLGEEFGYMAADQAALGSADGPPITYREAVTKKRRLDLLAKFAPTTSTILPAKRCKSPKKKPQTITDKATAPFSIEGQANTSTLLDYFAISCEAIRPPSTRVSQQKAPEADEQRQSSKRTSKAQRSNLNVNQKVKEGAGLLSPERAMESANEQDLLFGTSSQLAREESPTLIRDLQRAIKDSETEDSSLPQSQGHESQASVQSAASNRLSLRRPAAPRNLWSVAARDESGSLLDIDVVDMLDTPQPSRSFSTNIRPSSALEAREVAPSPKTFDDGWKTVGDVVLSEAAGSLAPEQHEALNSLPRSVAEASLRQRPKSRSPVKKGRPPANAAPAQTKTARTETTLPTMPNYDGYTDVDLRRAVTALGFKSTLGRKSLIALLQECWQSKNRRALQSLPPNVPGASIPAEDPFETATKSDSPAKKRGRPPKEKTATLMKTASEVESGTPPRKVRGRPRKAAAAKSLKTKIEEKILSPGLCRQGTEAPSEDGSHSGHASHDNFHRSERGSSHSPVPLAPMVARSAKSAIQDMDALFATITKVVRSYSSTHDAKNLTWYEKILLYDPIVLEDLADWLNKEGLRRVHCVTMVTPWLVKQWCESQSICCLWKENLRGGTRSRY